jgi:hypothetical protein
MISARRDGTRRLRVVAASPAPGSSTCGAGGGSVGLGRCPIGP